MKFVNLSSSFIFLLVSSILIFSKSTFAQMDGITYALASEPPKVGLFVASVDPITVAHMNVILAGVEQLQLTHVFIIAKSDSDKDYSASVSERINLIKETLKDFPNKNVVFTVMGDPKEGKRAFATRIAKDVGNGHLYQIAGEDVQEKAKSVFGGVPGMETYILPRLNPGETIENHSAHLIDGVHLLDVDPSVINSISSTEVKQRLESGQAVDHMLNPRVLQQIIERKLYSPLTDNQAKAKGAFLKDALSLLFKNVEGSSKWNQLKLPKLTGDDFVLREGVSVTNNLSFNRIQSFSASLELLIRIVMRENPELKNESAFEFRMWCLESFKSNEFKALELNAQQLIESMSPKALVVKISADIRDSDVISRLKEIQMEKFTAKKALVLHEGQLLPQLQAQIASVIGNDFTVEFVQATKPEFATKADQFLRQNKVSAQASVELNQSTLIKAGTGLSQLVTDLSRRMTTGHLTCEKLFR